MRESHRFQAANRQPFTPPLGLLLSLLVGFLFACGADTPRSEMVVLISLDTLRADHVGLYGYPRDTTPRIDAFFESKTIFENAMSSAPCTVPSVIQFLWGSFLTRPGQKPIAEILRDTGFATAAFVSQHQFRKGSVESYRRGFETFDLQQPNEVDHHGLTTRRASQVSDGAIAWLEETAGRPKRFLWLHYFDPHDPYDPPPAHRLFDAGVASSRSGDRRLALKRGRRSASESWQRAGYIFSPDDVAHLVDLYDGEIHYADSQIGRVLDALEAGVGLENAIVVLISDHGEWLGEHDRWDHCMTLREQEVRVPFLVSVRGGRLGDLGRASVAASTLDVLPSLMGLLGIGLPSGFYDGEDLRLSAPERVAVSIWARMRVARSSGWKLIQEGEEAALYDVRVDPQEQRNLIEQRPAIGEALLDQLANVGELGRRVEDHTAETIERLRKIGYID